jgi:hypothetical protein
MTNSNVLYAPRYNLFNQSQAGGKQNHCLAFLLLLLFYFILHPSLSFPFFSFSFSIYLHYDLNFPNLTEDRLTQGETERTPSMISKHMSALSEAKNVKENTLEVVMLGLSMSFNIIGLGSIAYYVLQRTLPTRMTFTHILERDIILGVIKMSLL